MKNLLTKSPLYLTITLMLSCSKSGQDTFFVEAHIAGLQDTEILILRYDEGVQIDTIHSVGGKFSYSGSVANPMQVQFLAQVDTTFQKLADFILENSNITVEGSLFNLNDIKISGSQLDKILKAYLDKDQILENKWDSIKIIYDDFKKINDSANIKKYADQLDKILREDRVNLLKSYVLEYYNETAGALIPNFCSIGDILSAHDYLEMYHILSADTKQSYYGQMIKLKSEP